MNIIISKGIANVDTTSIKFLKPSAETNEKESENFLDDEAGFPGIEALRGWAQASGQALIEIAGSDLYDKILVPLSQGDHQNLRAIIPFMQAIHHATEHRTQVHTILGQLGIEPPEISVWSYRKAMNY